MEKFILSLDQIVRWVMGSFEFLTRDFFFCSLTELAWCELPGSVVSGTALWSWWSSLFQTGEVVCRCCTWSWTCLAALDAFDVICVQKWTKLSHSAPVQLLSLILGLSSAWWRIGSRSLGTSGFVVSPCNLQVFRQHSTLYIYARPACQLPGGNMAPSSSPWELSSLPTWLWLALQAWMGRWSYESFLCWNDMIG